MTCLCAVLLLLCRRRLARRFLSSASGPRLEPPARHASEWRTAKRPIFGAEPPQDGVGGSGDGGGRSERSGGATVPAATPSLPLAPDPPGAPSLADPADNASPDGRVDAAPPAASPAPAADAEDASCSMPSILLQVVEASSLAELCSDWGTRSLEERRAKLRELQRSCHPDKHRRSVPAIE